MIEAEKPMFVAALTELASLKPGAKLTTEQYGAWWNALRNDWALPEFRAACATLAREVEFMPNPFHFERLRKRASLEVAGDAWARAVEHARRLPTFGGHLVDVSSGDEFLDRVARACGGFKAIANATERDLQFIGQRFAEHHAAMSESLDAQKALPGIEPAAPRDVRNLVSGLVQSKRISS